MDTPPKVYALPPPTAAEDVRKQVIEVLRLLLGWAEKGQVDCVVIAAVRPDGSICTQTTGGASYTTRIGMFEVAKADLIAQAEGRLPERTIPTEES